MSIALTAGLATLGGAVLSGGSSMLSSLPTAISIYSSAKLNTRVHERIAATNLQAQKERDERLAELQERQRLEDKNFQLERDKRNERFQMEMEAQRMSFQEHLELRRLQFQAKMEKCKEEFQLALTEKQQQFNREIAQYQAMAMRDTQILVARENAQNMLGNQMVLEALKTFPLNISPLVLLNNRPHSLSSLLRFTIDEKLEIASKDGRALKRIETSPKDMLEDVMNYKEHPEALSIFIAPLFVDSRFSFQKTLSSRIWEATYQKIESFFTKYYSRDSMSPVLFYPTAWNDKYTSGVHASETLHYFLKDMPCIVLEPKFDGNKFRMAVSYWGLGYASTDHHRIEWECDVNTDLAIANAVYERSVSALDAINTVLSVEMPEMDQRKYHTIETILKKNISLYKAFGLGDIAEMTKEGREGVIRKLSAIGIGNIFTIDYTQDLEPLAEFFSEQIGVTLAMFSDLHHLIATDADPLLPDLMHEGMVFPEIYANKKDCEKLHEYYKSVYASLRDEERSMASSFVEAGKIDTNRNDDIARVRRALDIQDIPDEPWQEQVRDYVQRYLNFTDADFDIVWSKFVNIEDTHVKDNILRQIPDDEDDYRDQLESRM